MFIFEYCKCNLEDRILLLLWTKKKKNVIHNCVSLIVLWRNGMCECVCVCKDADRVDKDLLFLKFYLFFLSRFNQSGVELVRKSLEGHSSRTAAGNLKVVFFFFFSFLFLSIKCRSRWIPPTFSFFFFFLLFDGISTERRRRLTRDKNEIILSETMIKKRAPKKKNGMKWNKEKKNGKRWE